MVPMWKKGEHTEKQPVSVHDVANGVTAIIKDCTTAGKTYQFVGYMHLLYTYHHLSKVVFMRY